MNHIPLYETSHTYETHKIQQSPREWIATIGICELGKDTEEDRIRSREIREEICLKNLTTDIDSLTREELLDIYPWIPEMYIIHTRNKRITKHVSIKELKLYTKRTCKPYCFQPSSNGFSITNREYKMLGSNLQERGDSSEYSIFNINHLILDHIYFCENMKPNNGQENYIFGYSAYLDTKKSQRKSEYIDRLTIIYNEIQGKI